MIARTADIVAEIIDEITPLVISPELAAQLWNDIKVRKTAMFYLPVDTNAGAEVLMACADGKSAKFVAPEQSPASGSADFHGVTFLSGGGSAFGPLVTRETLAESVLTDLYKGQGVHLSGQLPTLDSLVDGFAGILVDNHRGKKRGRTFYAFHKMPDNPDDHPVHIDALTLIRDKLAKTKEREPEQFDGLPGFVFLVLTKKNDHAGLHTVVVEMLKRRFKREKSRTAHGPNE